MFNDQFSKQSQLYARVRPRYPRELFEQLAPLTAEHSTAFDCATGNGQAAVALAEYYDHVIAIDGSAEQLSHADERRNVTYKLALAEELPVEDHTLDIITVATAIHWFDLDRFYAEVRRALKLGGVIAVWAYFSMSIDPAIDELMRQLSKEILLPYWMTELQREDMNYDKLPFPFDEITSSQFVLETSWDLKTLLDYIHTWSATQLFIEANGSDPVVPLP